MSTYNYSEVLLDVQDDIRAELAQKPGFVGITVLSTRKNDNVSKIAEATAKYQGIFAGVSTLEGKVVSPNVEGPRMEITVVVTIIEAPALNRSDKGSRRPAEQLAIEAARSLHLFKPARADRCLAFESFGPVEDETLLILALRFNTIVNLQTLANLRET
jgi:hypothetical protein